MGTTLDRRAFGGQPERVEARREEHVEAVHALVARVNVGQREVPPVPQVQVPARVGEHHQGVVLGARGVHVGAELWRHPVQLAPTMGELEAGAGEP